MFKAKIIENTNYYLMKRKYLIIMLIVLFLLGLVSNITLASIYWTPILIIIAVVFSIFLYKTGKKVTNLTEKRKIHISNNSIEILNNSGEIEKEFKVSEADEIIVKDKYQISDESISDLIKEIKGANLKNYLIIKSKGKTNKFDFLVDSHYMILQMKKIINFWSEQNIKIKLD